MNQVLSSEDYSPYVYKRIITTAYTRQAYNKKQALINTRISFFLSNGKKPDWCWIMNVVNSFFMIFQVRDKKFWPKKVGMVMFKKVTLVENLVHKLT